MELPAYRTLKTNPRRLPPWLVRKVGPQTVLHDLKKDLRELKLHTVCEEARCPNIGECWSKKTATLMILGDTCTRHCGFCSVTAGRPAAIDPQEPQKVADMVFRLGLRHVVVTMVARDDLPDGGAVQVAETITAIRERQAETRIEVLTSDFQSDPEALRTVVTARPDVFNHNIETVERLTPGVRHRATYRGSLLVLQRVKALNPDLVTKSGLMLGLGETSDEIRDTLHALRAVGCELLTIGQYLRPSQKNLPVVEYLHPEVFDSWKAYAEGIGFRNVASGPFVRSSYHAEEMIA